MTAYDELFRTANLSPDAFSVLSQDVLSALPQDGEQAMAIILPMFACFAVQDGMADHEIMRLTKDAIAGARFAAEARF